VRRPVDKLLDDLLQAADVAAKLPEHVRTSMPDLPWKEIIGFRIVVDHAYHRLDYGRVWNTLCEDIPRLRAAIVRYRG
jgi:uncharacterized protein with HEPN domain